MQRGVRTAVGGGVIAVVAGAAAYGAIGAYHILNGPAGSARAAHASPTPVVTTPPTAAEVKSAASAFLTAWASGDTAKAAGLTDNEAVARRALGAYRTDFRLAQLTLTPQPAVGERVPFSVHARFSYAGLSSDWSYASQLTVGRDAAGRVAVQWAPSVVYPSLLAGQGLAAVAYGTPPVKVLDRAGRELTAADHPSLTGILADLRTRYGSTTHGTPGMEIRVRDADGTAGTVLHVLSHGTAGTPLPTTIDATVQAAAERSVTTQGPDASVVAIQPSTGGILAVANNPANGYNKAMLGQYAPGSTFKVITAATLLSTGKYAPSTPLKCPKNISYGGRSFHNVEGMALSRATLAVDFAASCNTAFISTAATLPDGAVEREAHDVFGLGLTWSTGVSSWDGSVPAGSGSQKAMTFIGQGRVQVSPLDMASVAATARAGAFHQPYLVPASVDHRQLAQAPRRLTTTVAAEIRSLMRLTATSGTAAPRMAALGGDIGAKTGTAEVDGQAKPNSWFVGYRNDVAAAAVVPKSGEGYQFAGRIVAAVLSAH